MNQKIIKILIIIIAVIFVLGFAFLVQYYSFRAPVANIVPGLPAVEKQLVPTKVIFFSSPEVLPTSYVSGNCFANSVAAPFRADAWRCMVENSIYDPCFDTEKSGFVFCQASPLIKQGILIKITKPLPKPEAYQGGKKAWAWFVLLKDGTFCTPFTGTRPFFGNNQIAYYGCESNNKDQQIVLLGDLVENTVWMAQKAVLTKNGDAWKLGVPKQVEIDTVWQ